MKFHNMYVDKNIFIVENVFDDDLCDSLIEFLDRMTGTPYIETERWDHEHNVQCKFIKFNKPPSEYYDEYKRFDDQLYQRIDQLSTLLSEHVPGYTACGDSGYCLRKIHGATRQHTDGIYDDSSNIMTRLIRSLSIVIALNDDHEDGLFSFPVQGVQVKLKKGTAVCFPPYWTHPHKVSEPSGRDRYTINTWFYQKQYQPPT